MLVLSRRSGESITIGADTEIRVLGIQGNRVRLGVLAPSGVCVWRAELVLGDGEAPIPHRSYPGGAPGAGAS